MTPTRRCSAAAVVLRRLTVDFWKCWKQAKLP